MPHHSQPCYSGSEPQCRLLYVGSDLSVLKFLRSTFGKPMYHVVSCPDRGSAEMFMKSQIPYRLFIFDHEMRDRAAFDLARLVRSLAHRKNAPAIVIGAEVDSALHEFTLASGGSDYVLKADDFSAVSRVVRRLLKESSSARERDGSGTAFRPDKGS
jgi:DNA-binding response OmpR family regulator